MERKIALVTGGNRGIGREIVRQLAQDQNVQVVMTVRSQTSGQSTLESLRAEGLHNIAFEMAELASAQSIQNLITALKNKWGRVDILVNNAGVLLDTSRGENSVFEAKLETLQETFTINLYAPLLLIQGVVPLMKQQGYGRIVNLSSGLGQLAEMGGGYTAYRLSKAALNALTRIVAAEVQGRDILVNALCPGWVQTDMGGAGAPRTPAQGADTAVWLATLPPDGPQGGFFRDRLPIPW